MDEAAPADAPTDESVEADTIYFYKVGAVDLSGTETIFGPVMVAVPVGKGRDQRSALRAGPNPFTGSVLLRFTMDSAGSARLAIYNASGRLVRLL